MDLHKAGLAWRWRPNPSESDCLLIYRYRQSAQLGLPCAAGLLRIRPNPPESDPPSQPQSRPYIFGLLVVATCLRLTTLPPGRNLATARCEYTRVSYNGVTASSGRRRMSRGDGAAPTRNFRDHVETSDDGTLRHAGARIHPRLPDSRLRPPRVLPQPPARRSLERVRLIPHGRARGARRARSYFSSI